MLPPPDSRAGDPERPAAEAKGSVAPPLGDRAARGFVVTLLQFGGTKFVTLLGQYAISWILGDEDFGYVGLAMAVGSFGALFSLSGMRDVLVRRWRNFDELATPALWMSVAFGVVSMLVTFALAPIAGGFFRDTRLTSLILLLGVQNLLSSFAAVPDARLTIDMRFKLVAGVQLGTSLVIVSLSIVFALAGMGASSLILPWPIAVLFRGLVLWAAARPPVRFGPQFRLWRELGSDNSWLFAASFFFLVASQFDYFILGRMYADKAVVGQYFWAYNLSMQALQMLSQNLGAILLPSMALLQDEPERQLKAFLRAAKALLVLSVPACLLQATLADPLIRLFFREEWYPAIPIVVVLSVGWTLMAMNWPALNLLKAQGRFAAFLGYMAFTSAIFVAAVYIGARVRAGVGAAAGVLLYSAVGGPLAVRLAIRPLGGSWRNVIAVFAIPMLAGFTAFGLAVAAAWYLPVGRFQHVARVAVICVVAIGLYAAIVRRWALLATEEVLAIARNSAAALRAKRSRGSTAAPCG